MEIKVNVLMCSSLLFMTNVVSTLYKQKYIYSLLFTGLTGTSLMFHYNTNLYTNLLDKMFILMVVGYGGYRLYDKTTPENNLHVMCITFSFVSTLVLFYYGYCTNQFCYHPEYGDYYHCLLHAISSAGHHWIVLL